MRSESREVIVGPRGGERKRGLEGKRPPRHPQGPGGDPARQTSSPRKHGCPPRPRSLTSPRGSSLVTVQPAGASRCSRAARGSESQEGVSARSHGQRATASRKRTGGPRGAGRPDTPSAFQAGAPGCCLPSRAMIEGVSLVEQGAQPCREGPLQPWERGTSAPGRDLGLMPRGWGAPRRQPRRTASSAQARFSPQPARKCHRRERRDRASVCTSVHDLPLC